MTATASDTEPSPRRRGRPADVDPDRVALLALRHFTTHGYETTTMDEVAAIAGIGRRTLFRYFPSKPDLVWGGIEPVMERMHRVLGTAAAAEATRDVLARAMTESLDLGPEAMEATRLRLRLMASDPALIAYGVARLGENRDLLADFIAGRLGVPTDDLRARVLSDAISSANFSALLWWATNQEGDDPARAAVEAVHVVVGGLG